MEICIKDKAIPEILTWLDSLYEEVSDPTEMDDVVTVNCYSSGESVPVSLTLGVEDASFVGVWFNSDRLYWKNLVELANQASRYFGVAVRYEKTDLSSVFYEVSNGQTREVNW